MKVIFYTTHCPACAAMERILKSHNVEYVECTDVEKMKAKGFQMVPWIEFPDGTLLNLKGAIDYYNKK